MDPVDWYILMFSSMPNLQNVVVMPCRKYLRNSNEKKNDREFQVFLIKLLDMCDTGLKAFAFTSY